MSDCIRYGDFRQIKFHAGLSFSTRTAPRIAFIRLSFQLVFSDAEKEGVSLTFNGMATISVIRHSDGRTYYPCGTSPYPPTNPKAGTPTSGNTVVWNGRTRATTLVVPRQNPVNIDTWSPQSHLRNYTGPVTYGKPPFREAVVDSVAVAKKNQPAPCPPTVSPQACGT